MKEAKNVLFSYIKSRIKGILIIFISFGIFAAVFSLYDLPMESVGYASILTILFILTMAAFDFFAFVRRHHVLEKFQKSITISDLMLPKAKNLIEEDYQLLIQALDRARLEVINEKDRAYHDMMDYYTLWAHQIKTPISAMRLVLQSSQSDENSELQEQLFRVEQYVDMVLQYLRTESMNADLLLKRVQLDDIIKHSVKHYAKTFIRKKIRLNYTAVNHEVLTDEKWLSFVLKQVLSNALKYTNSGEISIYMDADLPETLVIEDTGVGIEQEDLPRIFERGFTGYNGRMDKKSTGIGLYLCKRVLDRLSHTIHISSEVGKGTRVMISFSTAEIADE